MKNERDVSRGPGQAILRPFYADTPEKRAMLEEFHARGDEPLAPITILARWGFEIRSADMLNRFIVETWEGVFPVEDGRVVVPARMTEVFLRLFGEDPVATLPLHTEEGQEAIRRHSENGGQIRIRIGL